MDIAIEWDGNVNLVFSSFEKNNIVNMVKNIKLFIWEPKVVKYPASWVEQKGEIETFVVLQTSK